MLNISLRLQHLTSDVLLLRLPHIFRVFFGILTVILIYGLFTSEDVPILPAIILLISVLALLYDERWRFDRARGVVEWRIGLVGLVKPGSVQLDEVERFVLGELTKGAVPGGVEGRSRLVQRRYVHLTMTTKSGDEYDIERRAARSGENLQTIAREVARFCERPLDEE